MRTTLLASAFLLAACSRSDRVDRGDTPAVSDAPSAGTISGPDQLVLRFPRDGGIARAFAYPELDSVVWRSPSKVPPIVRVLAFDENAGSVAAVDSKGVPVRIDLRLGAVSRDPKPTLTKLRSSDGTAVYGISKSGRVTRLTPTGSWTFKPPRPAREIFPQPDGSVLVLADAGDTTKVWHLFPPETSITDTAALPRVERAIDTPIGDRLYLTVDSGLIALRSRDLSPVRSVRIGRRVQSVVTTPSGDRIYVAPDSAREILVIDRYSGEIDARIGLPGIATELRMDPTGRYALARPAGADSAWVLAVGTDRLHGAVQTAWRSDLPFVAPDGAIALLRGKDVVLVDGETLRTRHRIPGAARDQWLFVAWNGFRPRTVAEDEPVEFPIDSVEGQPDTLAEGQEGGQTSGQVGGPADRRAGGQISTAPVAAESAWRATATGADSARPAAVGFTVQFAALRSEDAAQEIARSIRVQGVTPRVVTTVRGAIPIHRVVIGPFATRAEAERVAKTSGRSYWVYEGSP